MNESEILKGNRLIAEFEGKTVINKLTLKEDRKSHYYTCNENNNHIILEYTRYHKEWNWLMPIVELIEAIGCRFVFTTSNIGFLTSENSIIIMINSKESKLNRTHEAVVEFIKWYNKQKPIN